MELEETLLTAKEACAYLRMSLFTLNRMEKLGLLTPFRTPGGHRRYSLEMLREYLEASRNHSFNPPKGNSGDQQSDQEGETAPAVKLGAGRSDQEFRG